MDVVGYTSRLTAAPGESVEVMVHCTEPEFEAEVVRLSGGGPRPDSEDVSLVYESVGLPVDGRYPGVEQVTCAGSYAVVPHDDAFASVRSLLVTTWVYATRLSVPQGLIGKYAPGARRGWALRLERSRPAFSFFDGAGEEHTVVCDWPVVEGQWHLVGCSIDLGRGSVVLFQRRECRLSADGGPRMVECGIGHDARIHSEAPIVIAGTCLEPPPGATDRARLVGGFNGKLDGVRIGTRALDPALDWKRPGALDGAIASGFALAAWDFSRDPATAHVADVSGCGRHGSVVNAPLRAVTGHNWNGDCVDHRLAPEQYAAIHFHDDDLDDAAWEPAFEVELPPGLASGIYAARLTTGRCEDFVPFFVRPPRGQPTAPIAVILPTFTYMAYSNSGFTATERTLYLGGREAVFTDADACIVSHPQWGRSLYNRHADGTGIAHVSMRRPMVDIRPDYRSWLGAGGGWSLSGDIYLVDWLEAQGLAYDVLTDHVLHEEGAEALAPYRAVMTGAHPEYASREMLAAYAAYAEYGGRILYLGGNGFYWVTSVLPDREHVLEVRRGGAGDRQWEAAPGEDHHGDGQPGVLWRYRGQAPQRVFGVGFAAQGGGGPTSYRRTPDGDDPRAAFIFEGVPRDAVIGGFEGTVAATAWEEVDRADRRLGTPADALVVATSSGRHGNRLQSAPEELPQFDPRRLEVSSPDVVRADMTYFETKGGGAVFSTGAITWSAQLAHDDYDNHVSRITANVIREFVRDR